MLDFSKSHSDNVLSQHDTDLVASLVRHGVLPASSVDRAVANALRLKRPVVDVLLRQHDMDETTIAQHQARTCGAAYIDTGVFPPDPRLIDRLGAAFCLAHGILPWQQRDDVTVILTCRLAEFDLHAPHLTKIFGKIVAALTTEADVFRTIETCYGSAMVSQAETCVDAQQSCRDWNKTRVAQIAAILVALVLAAVLFAPGPLVVGLMIWAIVVLVLTTALKVAAVLKTCDAPPAPLPPVADHDLPVITMLVPLYRETAIASHLLVRLAALRYPRALLDVCLVLEQDDATTRATLARTRLPGWMRAVTVPSGQVKTKPRALNYALPFARGSIIGVWDAEDAPAPDQLHVVARHFAQAAPDVACLQGILDFYNTGSNWLTRCFTIEYAASFRVVLPGIARMGLVVPLGGTTLFFRRAILEELGGWDAHNVTEDADLGLRLARHGYKTALIPTVTLEEANGHAWPWVKQRSRWLKGCAITYGVHMRNPLILLHDLGWWRFFGVQVMFLGTLSLFVLLPAFWTLWLIPFGVTHAFHLWLTPELFWIVTYGFIAAEIFALLVNLRGLQKAGRLRLWGWALTLPVYFPLGALAAYRGLAELATRPFYWDKTLHGARRTIPQPLPLPHPVSAL